MANSSTRLSDRTIRAAGFVTRPYHAWVPSFGEWGYVLAGGPGLAAPSHLRIDTGSLKFLDDTVLGELFVFPRDMARVDAPVSRLND